MPVIEIKMWEGRDTQKKKELIHNVAMAVASTLEIPTNHINIIITDVPKENWGLGDVQASEK